MYEFKIFVVDATKCWRGWDWRNSKKYIKIAMVGAGRFELPTF
jgi:hypothetical protein